MGKGRRIRGRRGEGRGGRVDSKGEEGQRKRGKRRRGKAKRRSGRGGGDWEEEKGGRVMGEGGRGGEERGWGEFKSGRGERHCGTLGIYVLFVFVCIYGRRIRYSPPPVFPSWVAHEYTSWHKIKAT
jgi:hypothetical protein